MAGGGGGSGAPATVSPTANTSTVQHASNQAGKSGGGAGIPAVDTTSIAPAQTAGVDGGAGGGKSGGAGSPPANDIQFGGYGQQSPFGLTNPASWGESGGADLSGTTSSAVTNQFTGSDFYKQQSPQPAASIGPADEGSSFDDDTLTAGTLDTGAGTTLNYDAGEQQAAQNIANTIEAGGINQATGDNNISAGPNVLSAGDDGLFGWGDDYNNEFQQNYAAQSAHAEANPYGMSTGTPLSQQGFVQEGGLADGLINNSTIGKLGSALTGNNLISTTADLLPPPPGSERDAAGGYGKTGEEVEGGGLLSGLESATGLNLTGPIDPSINLHRGGGYDNRSSHSTDNDSIEKDRLSALPHGGATWSPALGRNLSAAQHANRAANGLPRNMGGPIPYNKGGPIPPGGK